jgi:hypothetical protein
MTTPHDGGIGDVSPNALAPFTWRRGVGIGVVTIYALTVGILAAFGEIGGTHILPLLIAIGLSLPFGVASFIGLYALTGFFNFAAAGFSSGAVYGNQYGAHGFLFVTCITLYFLLVAVLNAYFARSLFSKRAHRLFR